MIAQNIKAWHKYICVRDGYICQLQIAPECKKDYSYPIYFTDDGENPHVCGDHLKKRNAYPELKLETTNGKCVCSFCNILRENYPEENLPDGYLEPAIEISGEDIIAARMLKKWNLRRLCTY